MESSLRRFADAKPHVHESDLLHRLNIVPNTHAPRAWQVWPGFPSKGNPYNQTHASRSVRYKLPPKKGPLRTIIPFAPPT